MINEIEIISPILRDHTTLYIWFSIFFSGLLSILGWMDQVI